MQSTCFRHHYKVKTLTNQAIRVLSRATLDIEPPVGSDVHGAILDVLQELRTDRVNAKLLERVVDNAEFLLAVDVVRTYDPPSLSLAGLSRKPWALPLCRLGASCPSVDHWIELDVGVDRSEP